MVWCACVVCTYARGVRVRVDPSRRGATKLITQPCPLAAQISCTFSTTSFSSVQSSSVTPHFLLSDSTPHALGLVGTVPSFLSSRRHQPLGKAKRWHWVRKMGCVFIKSQRPTAKEPKRGTKRGRHVKHKIGRGEKYEKKKKTKRRPAVSFKMGSYAIRCRTNLRAKNVPERVSRW